MTGPTKPCRWPACQVKIPGRFDYCRAHWFSLPPDLRGPVTLKQLDWIANHLHNLRDYATGKHRQVDDYQFGGGAGMVMKPEPIAACGRVFPRFLVPGSCLQPPRAPGADFATHDQALPDRAGSRSG